jgi:CheY-like chemotaxis protein
MNGEPLLVLLVEDDAAHAEIARRNLSNSRVANRVVHVSDGQQALDYLFHEGEFADAAANPRPHVVLLDLRLPKVDGLEVLRRVREREDLKGLPVVVLTTSEAEIDIARAYANLASSYLVKPVDFDKFRSLMDTFGYYWLAWNRYPR